MSQDADREDRTEAPTAKRLREAKDRGDVPQSRELAGVAVLGASVLTVLAMGSSVARSALDWMHDALTFDQQLVGQQDRLLAHSANMLAGLAVPLLPMIAVAILACFISPVVMGGFHFSTKALEPNFGKLNPMAGLARMYGREGRVELLRSAAGLNGR